MLRNVLLTIATVAAFPALAGDISSTVDANTLSKGKTTPLGLYLTPADAHQALTADPAIVFIDVRDPIEINYVGHPEGMDAIVPLNIVTHEFNDKSGGYRSRANDAFVEQVQAIVEREGGDTATPVFLICRSGNRSAEAAKLLAEAGFTNAWNVVEGFEGDKDDTGVRSVNGWRNGGLPWSYKIAPQSAWRQ